MARKGPFKLARQRKMPLADSEAVVKVRGKALALTTHQAIPPFAEPPFRSVQTSAFYRLPSYLVGVYVVP